MTEQKKVLIVVTSCDRIDDNHPTGLWFEEFSVPYQEFLAKGFAVTVASPKGGKTPIDARSEPKSEQAEDSAQAWEALQHAHPLDTINADEFDAIFLPGGHGTMFDLPENTTLQQIIAQFAVANKVIAAVCHGPAGLVGVKQADGTPIVANKTVTAFTNEEESAVELDKLMPFLLETKLRELGSKFIVKPNWTDHIEQDGKLITGQNPQSSSSVARAAIAAINQAKLL